MKLLKNANNLVSTMKPFVAWQGHSGCGETDTVSTKHHAICGKVRYRLFQSLVSRRQDTLFEPNCPRRIRLSPFLPLPFRLCCLNPFKRQGSKEEEEKPSLHFPRVSTTQWCFTSGHSLGALNAVLACS